MNKIIIIGSSRNDGDTQKIAEKFSTFSDCDIINLSDYNISYFDYKNENKNDDYLTLMDRIITNYEVLIFATPVYWYSMSGIMKVFFDRLTDLLTIRKDLGRKLRTKKMAVMTTSIGNNLGEQFWLPFSETAAYLGMVYLGNLHTTIETENDLEMSAFAKKIEAK